MKFILASNSPRRRELLQQVGVDFQVIPSDCEEICNSDLPEDIVKELAEQKAENVAQRIQAEILQRTEEIKNIRPSDHPRDFQNLTGEDRIVLGADTVVSIDGKILGKPRDEKHAFQMLRSLQGRSHDVYSGVTLYLLSDIKGEIVKIKSFYTKTQVEVYSMTEGEIHAYIATGEPMDKAGAYGIQGRFAAYIKGIVGDYYNVVGLPVSRVIHELKEITADMDENENNWG